MTRLVILNQRGGVAKTTTVHTLARYLADRGRRVLIIDTDPQGSMGTVLGLKPAKYLHDFVIYNHLFKDCAGPRLPRGGRAVQQSRNGKDRRAPDGPGSAGVRVYQPVLQVERITTRF